LNANRVRIIGGHYRSRLLRFPSRPGLRPTPDRVRETLFNWLGQDLHGKDCLDLFAGSGALGLEAVSRGARRVVMVEHDRVTFRALLDNVRALGCDAKVELHQVDALEFARQVTDTFDVLFVDPPFGSVLTEALTPSLPKLIRPDGMVYLESANGIALTPPWHLHRTSKAGHVTFQLFTYGNQ
jgi:16S rRNA (guanine966-N2)-methyltransferase